MERLVCDGAGASASPSRLGRPRPRSSADKLASKFGSSKKDFGSTQFLARKSTTLFQIDSFGRKSLGPLVSKC